MAKFKIIFKFWGKYKKYIIKIQILEIISVLVACVMPYINTLIFDIGIGQKNGMILIESIVGYIALGVIQIVLSYAISMSKFTYRYEYEKNLKILLLDRFMSFKSNYSTADIDAMISSDVPSFVSVFLNDIMSVINSGIRSLFYWVIMFFLNWKLTIINMMLLSILITYNYSKGREREEKGEQNHYVGVKQIRIFNEIIRYIKEIKALGAQNYAQSRYVKALNSLNYSIKKLHIIGQKNAAFIETHNLFTESIFLGVGGWLIITGNMTIGMLIAFMGYAGNCSAEISSIIDMYGDYKSNKKSIDLVVSEIQFVEYEKKANELQVESVEQIRFIDFSFKYEDSYNYLLKGVNLVLGNKQINYIIGKSGIGKTTVIKCLMGALDQYDGDIVYDNINYKLMQKYSVESIISWVPQDPIVFSDTILGNISLGKDYDFDEIVECCKICQIYDEIMEMPDKFDTVIGDTGIELSGGQKQRISIVRALLQKKPIIIFDEITSGIDSDSMYKIKNNLNSIAEGKLIIIITHDMEFIVKNAKIFSIENNTIIEKTN